MLSFKFLLDITNFGSGISSSLYHGEKFADLQFADKYIIVPTFDYEL